MIHTKRFVRTIACLVVTLMLLAPASYADTDNSMDTWMQTVEDSFLNQQYIDMDGAYLGQCVDLAFYYAAELFKDQNFRQTIGLGNANQLFWTADPDYFEAIPFDGSVPKVGDLILWDHWAGGHVVVVASVEEDGRVFTYEQNSNMMGTAPVTLRELIGPDYGLPYLSYQPIGYLRPNVERYNPKKPESPKKYITEVLQ